MPGRRSTATEREHGRVEQSLREHVLQARRLNEPEGQLQRKGMLLRQRDDDAVVGGGRLQLQIEPAAEPLAQGEAPCAVDLRSQRSVDHELHPAGLVEKALGHNPAGRGYRSQRSFSSGDVPNGLPSA